MTELQKLLMVAQQDPGAMNEIRKLFEDRMRTKRAAGMTAAESAPVSFGQMSLDEMAAKGSGQKTSRGLLGGLGRAMDVDPNDVGGSIGIMDWLSAY